MLFTVAGARPAYAQCDTLCLAQANDQEMLLAPFTTLLTTPGGPALLAANFQTENDIYLTSTQAQKIAAGTAFIIGTTPQNDVVLEANVLLRAFPGNPNFGYNSNGLPTAPALPSAVEDAVAAIAGNSQVDAMKPYFGMAKIYDKAYGLLPGQVDSTNNPPPYQSSSLIQSNPFTATNSSAFAAANQQTSGAYGVNWAGENGSDSMLTTRASN